MVPSTPGGDQVMAQKVQVLLLDDLDGGVAEETVTFALDGTSYEIDLSSANAAKLRETLTHWVGHARRVGSTRGGGRGRGNTASSGRAARADRPDLTDVRAWARDNG